MPRFADAGLEVRAINLHGHGGSAGRERLNDWRLADYTDDLRSAIARPGAGPLVVGGGHSLGGAVARDWILKLPA